MDTLSKRLELLRKFNGSLSRSQLSALCGVPESTIVNIESKGKSPKADTLIKIAEAFPRFAAWLLIGDKTRANHQIDLDEDLQEKLYKSSRLQIIESVDARFMSDSFIKPGAMKSLTLMQSLEDETELGGYIELEDSRSYSYEGYAGRCVFITLGNINLYSTHGGKLALEVFRMWLSEFAPHLLKSADIFFSHSSLLSNVWKNSSCGEYLKVDQSNDFTRVTVELFDKWKNGESWA